MTDMAAWELIAECLEDSTQSVEQMTLHTPVGATAYVMKVSQPHFPRRVYSKFEFLVSSDGQRICGRSFHLEEPR
jgi:hypothetical protein